MTYVVSFKEFTPEARYDNVSFNHVTIEEAPAVDGTYNLIDTRSVNPGADPAHPLSCSFTTANALLPEGFYKITFRDAGGGQSPIAPVMRRAIGEAVFLPTLEDVGSELLSRTKDQFGNGPLGTFTDDTTPNDTQVLKIIDNVAPLVADSIGDTIPPELWDDAKKLIAVRAAMQIETSFFSDQVNTGRSVYAQLEKRYELELTRLQRQALLLEESGSLSPVDAGSAGKPRWNFPTTPTRDLMTRKF